MCGTQLPLTHHQRNHAVYATDNYNKRLWAIVGDLGAVYCVRRDYFHCSGKRGDLRATKFSLMLGLRLVLFREQESHIKENCRICLGIPLSKTEPASFEQCLSITPPHLQPSETSLAQKHKLVWQADFVPRYGNCRYAQSKPLDCTRGH